MKLLAGYKTDIYNCLTGFFMGSANVIPGVSGGTMLFIMGAFGKLIESLKNLASPAVWKMLFKGEFKAAAAKIDFRFLLFLTIGILVSFATLAKLMVYLLEEHTQLTNAFFFGLIAASIITVNRQMPKWSAGCWISCIAAAAATFAMISLVPVNTGDTWYTMMLCGAICIIAMILPGLSGSFLLLILGQYNRVWSAVSDLMHLKIEFSSFLILFYLAVGCIVGLGAFVHLVNFLMKRHTDLTIAALIGFMVGSLPRIWPFQHADLSSVVLQKGKLVPTRIIYELPPFESRSLFVFFCALAGFGLVLGIEYYAARAAGNSEKRS